MLAITLLVPPIQQGFASLRIELCKHYRTESSVHFYKLPIFLIFKCTFVTNYLTENQRRNNLYCVI